MGELKPDIGASNTGTYGHGYMGLLCMVAACSSSGYAGVYLELLLKQLNANVWTANMQLQIFCLPIAVLTMLSDIYGLQEVGPMHGWDGLTCVVVLLNAIGGFAVSLTMKYADNILKTFAVSMSLVFNCLLSWLFMSINLTPQTITGVLMVIAATWLYSIGNTVGGSGSTYVPVSTNVGVLDSEKASGVEMVPPDVYPPPDLSCCRSPKHITTLETIPA